MSLYENVRIWNAIIDKNKCPVRPNATKDVNDEMQELLYAFAVVKNFAQNCFDLELSSLDTQDRDNTSDEEKIAQIETAIKEKIADVFFDRDVQRFLDIIYNDHFPTCFTVFIEYHYVDRIYRDAYYTHYSGKHFSKPRDCVRLFLFQGEYATLQEAADVISRENIFIGSCVIQPNGIIGRSYFSPKYFLPDGYYVRTTPYTCTVQNYSFTVDAFPYMMQDHEATTCAEVTLLNLIGYYSHRYDEYPSILLSDIEQIERQHGTERVFPSRGISYADVARILANIGLSPRLYSYRLPRISIQDIKRYMFYYAESAIPFGIAVSSYPRNILHSIVCVGHGPVKEEWLSEYVVNYLWDRVGTSVPESLWMANAADAYEQFIVMDDGQIPYSCITVGDDFLREDNKIVEHLCVPLYRKAFLEADGAMEIIKTFLLSRMGFLGIRDEFPHESFLPDDRDVMEVGTSDDNPLIFRFFLASSKTFLSDRLNSLSNLVKEGKLDEEVLDIYRNLPYPRFIWVCELYSKESFKQKIAIGEVIVDATAEPSGIGGITLFHYPGYIAGRYPDSPVQDLESTLYRICKWAPFPQFSKNLKDFSNA